MVDETQRTSFGTAILITVCVVPKFTAPRDDVGAGEDRFVPGRYGRPQHDVKRRQQNDAISEVGEAGGPPSGHLGLSF